MSLIYKSTALILVSCAVLSSCSHYMDQSRTLKSWPIMRGEMQFYPDSNVLDFKSNMVFTADTEKWPAKSFDTQFPKGLKWYDSDCGTTFVFYYPNRQVIAIWVNIQNLPNEPDTAYLPGEEEVESFRNSKLSVSGHKYNIRNIPYLNKREQLMIRKRDAMILLYNIEEKNYDAFLKRMQTFKFI